MAGSVVIAGSVLTVLTVAQQLSGLHSLETREAVTEFLSQPPGSGLGLDVQGALGLIRIALMVVAGCATAAAVLGFHVLRGSRPARLGLTLVAVPLFFSGLATGGFLTSLVAAAATLLWFGPSRAWFDGTLAGNDQRLSSPPPPPPRVSVPPQPDQPPAFPAGPPHPSSPHPSWPAPVVPSARRPDAVVWACAITWASCALVVAVAAASLTLLLADNALLWEEVRRQNPELTARSGLDRDTLVRATYVTLAAIAVWSLAAAVLAVLVHRRSQGARIALIVSAGGAAAVSLLGVITSPVMLVPTAACLATVALLVRPEVRAWFTVSRSGP